MLEKCNLLNPGQSGIAESVQQVPLIDVDGSGDATTCKSVLPSSNSITSRQYSQVNQTACLAQLENGDCPRGLQLGTIPVALIPITSISIFRRI